MNEMTARVRAKRFSREALAQLPPALLVADANRLLDLTRTTGYRMIHEGTYPCAVLKVGDQHRVVTADLLRVLDLPDLAIRQRIASLPPAIRLPDANELLSLSRTTGYKLARAGQYPCSVLRVGSEYRVRKHELQRLLQVRDLPAEVAA
ncbi:helix-turn-helix transcriptional regulator [Kitasatospora griseola]|uniref:helix-turn-helix transcriptional regulator n=1 Tax=Kitasatospora griseola TaxID=2064 RepID=UPI0037F2C34F